MSDDEARSVGETEALFRQVNERLESLNEAFAAVTSRFEVVCECGDPSCTEQLSIASEDYEDVRSRPELFVVAPGHAAEHVEEVVARRGAYEIIRKHPGAPMKLAQETDPRRV